MNDNVIEFPSDDDRMRRLEQVKALLKKEQQQTEELNELDRQRWLKDDAVERKRWKDENTAHQTLLFSCDLSGNFSRLGYWWGGDLKYVSEVPSQVDPWPTGWYTLCKALHWKKANQRTWQPCPAPWIAVRDKFAAQISKEAWAVNILAAQAARVG